MKISEYIVEANKKAKFKKDLNWTLHILAKKFGKTLLKAYDIKDINDDLIENELENNIEDYFDDNYEANIVKNNISKFYKAFDSFFKKK